MRSISFGLAALLASGLALAAWAADAPPSSAPTAQTDIRSSRDGDHSTQTYGGVDLKSRAHTVAIVSALGDIVGYQALNAGLLSGGYSENIALDDAGLDEVAGRAALHTLTADLPGFGLVAVDVPRAMLVAHANSINLGDGPLDHMRDDLKPWRESHPVDLVVILMPGGGQIDRHDNIRRAFFGLGVSGRQTVLFLRAVVLDGRSGEILNDLKARAVGRLGESYTEASFTNPTPRDKAMLAAEMRSMIVNTVPGLLRNVGL